MSNVRDLLRQKKELLELRGRYRREVARISCEIESIKARITELTAAVLCGDQQPPMPERGHSEERRRASDKLRYLYTERGQVEDALLRVETKLDQNQLELDAIDWWQEDAL